MSLEVATYVQDLSVNDPPGSDPKSQGDDHIRLIKSVLKNTFPNSNKAMRSNDWVTIGGSYSAVAADDNKTLLCAPAGAMTITLPVPGPYMGWRLRVMRDASPHVVLVQAASGSINALGRSRVAVPYEEYVYVWTATEYMRIKASGEPQPGTIFYSGNVSIPLGYALANGQSLNQNDNPELYGVWGGMWGIGGGLFNCPNLVDRFVVAAGSGYGLGNIGGETNHILSVAETPAHSHTGTTDANNRGHTHDGVTAAAKDGLMSIGGFGWYGVESGKTTSGESQNHTHTFTTSTQGSSLGHENRPPYLALYPIFRLC